MNELGHCHDAAASCMHLTALDSCAELYHEDDGGLLGNTTYGQFGLVVHNTRGNKKKKPLLPPHYSERVMLFWTSGMLDASVKTTRPWFPDHIHTPTIRHQ
jgi:hypothetical protein